MPQVSLTWLPVAFAALVLFPAAVSAYAPPPPKPTPAEEAQKKALEAQKKQAHEALKAQEIHSLKSSYILLAGANNNYAGHKGKAMGEVAEALKMLDANALKKLQTQVNALQELNKNAKANLLFKSSDAADILQALSDAQVNNAASTLNQLAGALAANKQPKVLEHVQNAIKELNAAPRHATASLKGKEADVLTSAYVLLAAANHDYDGHRAKAMKSVEAACALLQTDLLANAIVQQKIKAQRDANGEAVAKSKENKSAIVHEPQAFSDAQLLLADALIQQTAAFLNATKQSRLLGHVGNAHKEIGIALTIR